MRLLPGIDGRFRRFKQRRRVARAHAELAGRAMQGRAWAARPHGLSRRLVVSLTSFPGRFDTLMPTLESLLFQTMRPDAVQLWIAHEDVARLPDAVRQLEPLGLDVRACADMRSYKKIVPALAEEPESLIVTADDDIWYWPSWLSGHKSFSLRTTDILWNWPRPILTGMCCLSIYCRSTVM